jgi:hypothetical protein
MDAPAVAVTRDGRSYRVAWMATPKGSKGRDVFWALAQAGGGFTADAPLQPDNGGTQGHPALAVDAEGTFHAAWEDEGGGTSRIRMRNSATPSSATRTAARPPSPPSPRRRTASPSPGNRAGASASVAFPDSANLPAPPPMNPA